MGIGNKIASQTREYFYKYFETFNAVFLRYYTDAIKLQYSTELNNVRWPPCDPEHAIRIFRQTNGTISGMCPVRMSQ